MRYLSSHIAIILYAVALIVIAISQNAFHINNNKAQAFRGSDSTKISAARNMRQGPLPAAGAAKAQEEKIQKNTSFPPETPTINSSGIINRVITDKKIAALTFDADMTYGMESSLKHGKIKTWYNEKLINELKDTKTPATLFLSGLWVKNYPKITQRLSADPNFEIASHSYSHPGFTPHCYNLSPASNDSNAEEITKTENLLKIYAPNYKKYFRFPGLCYDEADIKEIEKLGYKIIHGDVTGGDGFNHNSASIINRVVSRTKPGSIIILHMHGGPNAPLTAEAVSEIIRQLKGKGYSFVKVSELTEEK